MLEILDGFNKRMEFVAIIDSITNRRNTNMEIEKLFKENQMENLILSVLIYIMEANLAEEEAVTIDSIASFLREVLPSYHLEFNFNSVELKDLTRYIVKDVLQNKGQIRNFAIQNYETAEEEMIDIRLISDKLNGENEIIYELTKQGYDFLFRTKEVDDELGFKLEELKLKMLIQKKNYKKAISSSQNIIKMLRERKMKLEQFENLFKSNLNSISGIEYENIINDMYQTLNDGYNEMQDLEAMILKSKQQIKEEEECVEELDEKTANAKKEIWKISSNIKKAIEIQLELLSYCKKMKKLYLEVLQDSMEYSIVKSYNFKEVILDKLENINQDRILDVYALLLRPLFMPRKNKMLNLNICYEKQNKISKEEQDEYNIEQELLEKTKELEMRVERRNLAHVEVIKTLLHFSKLHKAGFKFSEYIESLRENNLFCEMINEKLIFMIFLKLYNLQLIDFEAFQKSEDSNIGESNGEFDLAYCLKKIKLNVPDFYNIKRIKIERLSSEFRFEYVKLLNEFEECNDSKLETNTCFLMNDLMIIPEQ